MNKIIILISVIIMVLTSCEQGLPTYDDSTARLNFEYSPGRKDTLRSYSFAYYGDAQRDTIWVKISTMGFPKNQPRSFELAQVATGNDDAIPGKHYVSFDDPEYKKNLVIGPDSVKATIPIIVLKDPSLDTKTYTLKVTFKENENFKSGYLRQAFVTIKITNMLIKPDAWGALCDYYFGAYGQVKHRFMMKVSGEKWDEDYLNKLGVTNSSVDQGYLSYLSSKFAKALREENAKREAEGMGVLKEEDGTIVAFNIGEIQG